MSIVDIVKQCLKIARGYPSLWLFGFVVALTASGGGSNGTGNGGAGAASGPGIPVAVIVSVALVVIGMAIVVRFVSEGALIEGVSRARRQLPFTLRDGFRAGVEHWGVLLRIFALYLLATLGSLAVLAVPCGLAFALYGRAALAVVAVPTVIVAAPWLITLYALQALASRIAVLENRYAGDAIRKARLFLHGRMLHALKLVAAAFAGTLVVAAAGFLVLAPLVLLLVGISKLLGMAAALVIGIPTLVPAAFVLVAVIGTMQSAAWTLGYLEDTGR